MPDSPKSMTDLSQQYDEQNSEFDITRYKPEGGGRMPDGSDMLANMQRMYVSFQHVPSGKSIFFKAFITAFNEMYTSNWTSEEVYGRNDPIHLFKNTTRKITLALKVPAASEGEAYENLGRIQTLTQFLYPNYTNSSMATTMAQSPLIRIKVMNLMQNSPDMSADMDAAALGAAIQKVADYRKLLRESDVSADAMGEVDKMIAGEGLEAGKRGTLAQVYGEEVKDRAASTFYDQYKSSPQSSEGLLGVIENLVVNHNLESAEGGVFAVAANTVLPKLINIDLSFSVLHEKPLGWSTDGDGFTSFDSPAFPYGAQLHDPITDAAKAADAGANLKITAEMKKKLGLGEGVLRAKLSLQNPGLSSQDLDTLGSLDSQTSDFEARELQVLTSMGIGSTGRARDPDIDAHWMAKLMDLQAPPQTSEHDIMTSRLRSALAKEGGGTSRSTSAMLASFLEEED